MTSYLFERSPDTGAKHAIPISDGLEHITDSWCNCSPVWNRRAQAYVHFRLQRVEQPPPVPVEYTWRYLRDPEGNLRLYAGEGMRFKYSGDVRSTIWVNIRPIGLGHRQHCHIGAWADAPRYIPQGAAA